MQITQTGDMIEIGSSVWLDTWGIDPRTHAEMERIARELQVVEIDGGSPVETPFDWYQPLSEPIFEHPVIQHQSVFMPLA